MDSSFIYEIKNNLSKKLCDNIIEKFEQNKERHSNGILGDPDQPVSNKQWKDSTELLINEWDDWAKAKVQLTHYMEKGLMEYLSEAKKYIYDRCDSSGKDDGYFAMHHTLGTACTIGCMSIQKVLKGRRYRWHCDTTLEAEPNRVLTFIWYLNTLEPDEDGKTKFINGREIRPEAGKLIFFPASWTCIHSGELIKADAKYMIVGGIQRACIPYKGI
jgi:hypothetical protein